MQYNTMHVDSWLFTCISNAICYCSNIEEQTRDTSDKNNDCFIAIVTGLSKIFEMCIMNLINFFLKGRFY